MQLLSNPKSILIFFISLIFILVLLNIASFIYWYTDTGGLFKLFNFNEESNIPTFFSVIILFISFLLLLFIALVHKKNKSNYVLWLVLCIIFLFLSFDEFVQIHERIGHILRLYFKFSGLLHFAWVIPYGILLISFTFIYYFKFLLKLPKKIMWLFIFSGIIYIAGALGFEMLAAKEVTSVRNSDLVKDIFICIEETFEMVGIALFIYTLLVYINEEFQINIESIKKQPQ